MARNDIHSPKNIQPADYEFVGMTTIRTAVDDEGFFAGPDDFDDAYIEEHMERTGADYSDHQHGGTCHVCGAWALDFGVFYHAKSNTYIRAGRDCAGHIADNMRSMFDATAKKRRALERRAKGYAKVAPVLEELGILDYVETMFQPGDVGGCTANNTLRNPHTKYVENDDGHVWADPFHDGGEAEERWDLGRHLGQEIAFSKFSLSELRKFDNDFMTLVDMVRKLVKYGSWSEGQMKFARVLATRLSGLNEILFKREEEKANSAPAPTGRVVVTGTIVSLKTKYSQFGETLKMLVKHESGYKVWSSVPAEFQYEVEKGQEVEFTVTLKPSDDDHTFAFGSRPAKFTITKILEK